MLDLNRILVFIAIVSPLIVLARTWRARTDRARGWKIAAALVLCGAAVALFVAQPVAGYVGGALWCLLLLLPSLAERAIDSSLACKRFGLARWLVIVRRMLRPWDNYFLQPALIRCLELARDGKMAAALDRLAAERSRVTPAGRFASALTFALTGNWQALAEWFPREMTANDDPAVRTLFLRALGEIGALDDLVWQIRARERAYGDSDSIGGLANTDGQLVDLVLLLAFCGRSAALTRLLESNPGKLPRDEQQFWLATAELGEAKSADAIARLEKLRRDTRDAVLQRSIEQRLVQAQNLPPALLSSANGALLTRLIGQLGGRARPARRGAPAVWILILLNLAMFGAELSLGGWTNDQTLHYLGALEPRSIIVRHEYWRLLTALFLHYGVLHIAFNLYALYLLGPALERIIGSITFAAGYLIAGLGSGAGVVLLSILGLTNAEQLVGASGSVMGVIGISAGLLLRHRQSPLAGRRLRNIVVIVALQTAFDLSTPQVSLAAHLSGFATGVAVGAVLGSSARRLTSRPPSRAPAS